MIEHDNSCKEHEYLANRYTDSRSFKESVYRIRYSVNKIPRCPVCGKPNNFIGGRKGYTKHCCCTCAQLDKEVRNKNKQTNLRLHGTENGAQSKASKEKYIKHIQEKYGDASITNAWQAKEVKKKIADICIKKYGVANYGQLSSHINRLKRRDVIDKREATKRCNHTFNTSKPESMSHKLLEEKYPDVIYQYKSEAYPSSCDFYIPSLDLYIECNYHWTHGGHPFTGSIEDNKKLAKWQSHNTKYYDNAIHCWTVRDVRKRQTAKANKLNYIEFWSLGDLKSWLTNDNR